MRSSARRRLLSPRLDSQFGKSILKIAASSGGLFVLSWSASVRRLDDRVEKSGNLQTVMPLRRWATGDRTSLAFSWPQTRRPDFTARAANVASADTNREGSLPLRTRRSHHFQLSAAISAR